MEPLYAFLGLVFGIAIAEAFHWRVGNAGERRGSKSGRDPRCTPAALSTETTRSCRRFTAQDYYDR